ncbi:MAG: cyclic nucleotide-binding domain-containing protein [Calothrix sp. SM1_5_4]|nr:cyclic nucleotide-binding domain-containing protein [Calothrix sp. SM1_5_4]
MFRAGEIGDCLYMVHSGSVDILDSDEGHLAALGPGSVFGEIALISDTPRTATARSKSYSDLYALPKSDFLRIVDAYPDFKKHLEEIMNQRRGGSTQSRADAM